MKKTPTLFLIVFWASTSITPLLAQWVQTNGPYGAEIRCLAVSGTNLFAGTNGEGVFRSTDNGNSWTVSGLTNRSVYALAVLDNNLFAGTLDGVVWRRQLPEMVTSVEALSTNLPAHFSLSQNYPNPFNPVTTITFGLPSESYVSLKVFDGLGREVATLISEELSAGNYAHKWNAESLPSGVYFYSMSAEPISGDRNDSFIETKKLILMK